MSRNGTLDYARLIAAFGIVFFHVGAPGATVGYAALPFFLMLLVLMSFPAAARLSFGTYVQGRASRLLIPWLIWSGIYGTLKLAEIATTGVSFTSEFSTFMLLTGPALHLWFLPFAFGACVLLYPVVHAVRPVGTVTLAVLMTGAALAALLLQQGNTLPAPFAQWVYALPAVFVGVALALVHGRPSAMAIILVGFTCGALLAGVASGLLQIVLASGALIICTTCPLPDSRMARLAGNLSMGVYLAHPLVLSVITRISSVPQESLTMALLVCWGALTIALAAYFLSRLRLPFGFLHKEGKT